MSITTRQKHRIWLIIAFIITIYAASQYSPEQATLSSHPLNNVEHVFEQHQSHVQLEISGTVSKLLRDDLDGSRHQKFIIKTNTGHTVLIAHNIDLASRINSLKMGDEVTIYGEYVWNQKGGMMHWTHHDPAHRHPNGWIKHQGEIYQ